MFDKLLVSAIEKIGPEVTVAVRGGPVLNDATLEDARATGICQVAKTISTGSNLSGIVLEECSKEFVDTFRTSDLIISKGQANFETLLNISGKPATVYILKVKCDLIARHLGSRVGSTRIILDAAG